MNRKNINISPLKKNEINQTAKLYKTSLTDNKKGFIQNIDFHGGIENMRNEFKANNGNVYVLKEDHKIIGMGALKKVDNDTVEICKLHLYPTLKGQGLGKKLSLALMEYAKELGYTKMNLHVTKTQKEAVGLYGHLGFTAYKEQVYKMELNGKALEFDTLYMEKDLFNCEFLESA